MTSHVCFMSPLCLFSWNFVTFLPQRHKENISPDITSSYEPELSSPVRLVQRHVHPLHDVGDGDGG